MKKNEAIAYVLMGTSLVGAYVIGRIDGFRHGFHKACTECINIAKDVVNKNSTKNIKETK